ncbi:MAG: aminotransferase class IV [Gammaproteobacteria bacterium]
MSSTSPSAISTAANPYAAGCAWIEGDYVPIGDARIPILDTGFTRSDCTYDVVAVWAGRFFRLEDHLDRFERSWRRGRFNPPLARTAMRDILFECVRRAALEHAYVEMIVSRGVAEGGERDPRRFRNRFYALAIPYVWIARPEAQTSGISLVVARTTTRIDPGAVDPTMKNFHWGDLTQGLFEAYDRDASNVVLLNAAGEVTEGPGFNIFAVCDGTLCTPAAGVLEGITRQTVIDLARRSNRPIEVTRFGAQRLHEADELFITSTAGGVMPVTRLDGRAVGNGQPGPVTLALRQAYWDAHSDPAWSTAVG